MEPLLNLKPDYETLESIYVGPELTLLRCKERVSQRVVLVKTSLSPRPSSAVALQLENEYATGSKLNSDLVIVPLRLERIGERLLLILEDFRGESLDRLGTPVEIEKFLGIAIQLASILDEVHGKGIIHKDIKPQNIVYDPRTGKLKLTDFGIATQVPKENQPVQSPNLIAGSLPYMSPEQTGRMNRTLDYRTDMYSLGVTFYELLTGKNPYRATDPIEWVHFHIAKHPVPPAKLDKSIPEPISAITMKLLSKLAEERYQTAIGLKTDLEECLKQWRESGRIQAFPLARRDTSDRLQISPKLYGREKEVSLLVRSFEECVRTGTPELIMVSGYSGIGKSSLVAELHKPVVQAAGFFCSGKYDPFKRTIPYLAFSKALGDLFRQILTEPEESISEWRERLLSALAENAQLIIEVVPEVEWVIGKQPAPKQLPPAESESRFNEVFRHFIGALAARDHPLAIFLDDLQWADPGSLRLIRYLITHPETRFVTLVGAYRNNEVSPSHPLIRTLDEIQEQNVRIRSIVLEPLGFKSLNQLISDSLHLSGAETAPLARLVLDKTNGNPFFAIQFLTALNREGLLVLNRTKNAWDWNISAISARRFTDNVIHLMISKLRKLPLKTQIALRSMACVGHTLDLATLSAIAEATSDETRTRIEPAVSEGLILPEKNKDREFFHFLHDRVQQSAYALIPEAERAPAHLKIGRHLLTHGDADERVFEIVNQFNQSLSLLTDKDEKLRVSRLNLIAGLKARTSSAYLSAIEYFSAGMTILPSECWKSCYNLTYGLYFNRAECEFFVGNFAEAERLFGILLAEVDSKIERAAVYRLKSLLHVARSENPQAVAAAVDGLALFGIQLDPHPSFEEVKREYDLVWTKLDDRPIEDLIHLPEMTSKDMLAVMEILSVLYAPAFFTDQNLIYLHLSKMVNISLEYGNCGASTSGYGWFGVILGPVFHRYQEGYRFGKLACALAEKPDYLAYKAKTNFSMELCVFWTQPIRVALGHIRTAFAAGVETGDIPLSCYCCNHALTDMLLMGSPLNEVYAESERGLDFVRKTRFRDVIDIIVSIQRFIQNMRGQTANFSTFSDPQFDEVKFERQLTPERMATMVCWYYIIKMQARYLSGDYEESLKAGELAKKSLWASVAHPQMLDFHYFHSLALAAPLGNASLSREDPRLEELKNHRDQLAEWEANCSGTFRDKRELVSAELARVTGDFQNALNLYERAIRSAREGGFPQNEAIANERAGSFFHSLGLETAANAYLREAINAYAHWGAYGKVRHLERIYPQLLQRKPPSYTATIFARQEEFDLISIAKASQAISQEILPGKLTQTLMQVLMEFGGAQKGCLIFGHDDGLKLESTAITDRDGIHVELRSIPVQQADLPLQVINYVVRSREKVVIDDARVPNLFSSDDYVSRRQPKSLLCLPILRQAKLLGILYLENNFLTGAFAPERIFILELLASQAAISLENSRLYSNLERTREGLEKAHQGIKESEERLRSILDNSATLIYMKDLKGRYLMVNRKYKTLFHLRDEQILGKTAYSVWPKGLADTLTTHDREVLRKGQPMDYEESAPVRGEIHTFLSVKFPLFDAHGAPYALCGISSDISERKRAEVERSRLLEQLKESLRLRDEFISIASHELKTPLTPLRLQMQILDKVVSHPVLSDHPQAASLKKMVSVAEGQLNRLSQLINDLLDVSRIRAGRIMLEIEEFDLSVLAREIVERFRAQCEAAGSELQLKFEPVTGPWDRLRLEQAIINLLSNAIKYGAGRPISLSVFEKNGFAELRVQDHGIGIAEEDQKRIFDRFERAVSLRSFGGLGLGLYITRQFVEAHGGTIQVESKLREGATFIVRLPHAKRLKKIA